MNYFYLIQLSFRSKFIFKDNIFLKMFFFFFFLSVGSHTKSLLQYRTDSCFNYSKEAQILFQRSHIIKCSPQLVRFKRTANSANKKLLPRAFGLNKGGYFGKCLTIHCPTQSLMRQLLAISGTKTSSEPFSFSLSGALKKAGRCFLTCIPVVLPTQASLRTPGHQ